MTAGPSTPRRGRPRTITRERIANAGIDTGLARITFVGIASSLGVSHMALYKHVRNLEALKRLVAEEIFERWRLPQAGDAGCDDLGAYLSAFSTSMWQLIGAHPGLAPYLLRRDTITPAMEAKIADHQARIAHAYGLSVEDSRWLLFTLAYHCVALADTVHAEYGDAEEVRASALDTGIDEEYALGIRALIVGALAILSERGG